MLSKIRQYLGLARTVSSSMAKMNADDTYQLQRTHEEAKKHRKEQKKAKADKAARKRNRRK